MQPSEPTPGEREARAILNSAAQGACVLEWGGVPRHPSSQRKYERDFAGWQTDLDHLTALAYQRGVRDAMARVAHTRSVYTNNPESDFATGWHEACDAISRFLRALTPPEPTE